MSRRRRLVLVVLAVLVGVPLLAMLGVGSYLRGGGLERQAEHAWSERGLPGRLRIGSVRLDGIDRAVAEDVSIGEAGQPPLVHARRVQATFDLLDRRLLSLRIDGARGGLDAARYRLLHGIIAAEQEHPPTRAPQPVRIEIADGTVELPGGTTVADIAVTIDATGPKAEAEGVGSIGGRPVRVAVSTDRATPDAPIITTVELREASASPAAVLAALEGMGLIAAPPAGLAPWLPGLVEVGGSTIQIDPVSDTVRGQATATWSGGSASCQIDADARRISLRRLVASDQRLGSIEGALSAGRAGEWASLDAATWRAGAGLPIPAGLPLADIAKLLPELQVRWPTGDRRTSVALVGPGRARLEALVGGPSPVRIAAAELPLVMIQGLLPRPLVLGGGHVVSATATMDPGRPEFSGEVRQARLLAEGWSFGPLDGQVAAVATPDGGVQVSARLPIGPGEGTGIAFTGEASGGRIVVDCPAIEALLARLRGPIRLPDVTGKVGFEIRYRIAGGGVQVDVPRLELSEALIRLANRDFARRVSARMSGAVTAGAATIEVDLGGHLRSGDVRIPDEWLPLAAQSPLFSIDIAAAMREGQLAELVLRRAMVRAADASGEPTPGGYSAQLEGKLSGEGLAGRVVGIVDHADLAWIASRIVPGQVKVDGEGAVAFQALIDGGEARRIDGTFLPLGADLDIERGKLRVGGITGGIRFAIGGQAKP